MKTLCLRHRWRAPESFKLRVLVSPQCGIDCVFVAVDSRCDGADWKQQDLSQSMYDGQLSFAHGFARKPRFELVLWQCLAHFVSLKKKKSGYWNLHLSKVATDGRVFENVGSTFKTHQINDGRPSKYNHFFISWRMYSECIRRWFWMYSGCIRVYSGVFECIPALSLRHEQKTHLNIFTYIPNVSKTFAITGQKYEGAKKMKNLAELTLLKF